MLLRGLPANLSLDISVFPAPPPPGHVGCAGTIDYARVEIDALSRAWVDGQGFSGGCKARGGEELVQLGGSLVNGGEWGEVEVRMNVGTVAGFNESLVVKWTGIPSASTARGEGE